MQADFIQSVAGFMEDSSSLKFTIKGAGESFIGYLLSSSIDTCAKKQIHILIEDTKEAAEYRCGDLYNIYKEPEKVYYFPTSTAGVSKIKTIKDASCKVQRSITLSAIGSFSGDSPIIIVTYPDAVKEAILNKAAVKKSVLKIGRGDTLSFDFVKEVLAEAGFEREDYVTEPGQFAIRGSIIDVFSYSDNSPYRLDFFGDEVESIKKFDVNTQRSSADVPFFEIFPNIYENSQILAQGSSSFFDFLDKERCIIWHNTFENIDYQGFKSIVLNANTNADLILHVQPQPSFNKNFALLADDIRQKSRNGYKVYISSSASEQIERLRKIFSESSEIAQASREEPPYFEPVNYSVHSGFVMQDVKVCLYTDHQIFDRFHRVQLKHEVERSERLTLEELNAFHPGDYVVHIDHGVGVFGGLVKTNVNGKMQEAIKLVYRDGDVIFVSVHGLHKLAKYKSKDGEPPKIYKLGSGAWNKLKSQTKAKIKDIAKDLINLYAKRRQSDGFAFSGDTYLQNELEASFIYEDTPDQSAATKAVKADMEAPHPMDRLICGDVGFGKTEVAIRAAFKAVCDSKQVCVLVPTTILALQHYKTFTDRLAKFPCKIEYVSRLRTSQEIKQTSENLKSGVTDIVIGTHRLLNKQIEFKDLGLLIIDEEQKFGVAAKERLRELKVEVDTLTLTATPIPRTLQFSLLGARDLSIINTPPPNRLPIHTEIIDFNEELIREAITAELRKGGQIFFVHNKVEDILAVEQMIKRICPGIKSVVGHGQMPSKELEAKMLEFIRGDYDILIATTIIENGIDIPNANTIIINQAQNFGLSDLHQLRGRVGRSNTQAYCYLIVLPMTSITEDAKRRIKAIEAFSELGSGFNIAMQDLDIRGAGNMLGGEQSGFIADMGFETYQRILNEAFIEINSEMGNPVAQLHDTAQSSDYKQLADLPVTYLTDSTIDTDLELFIPDEYVPGTTEKLKLYKELDSLNTEEDIKKFLSEMEDRFGPVPEQINQLTFVVRMRRLAIKLGFEKIVIKAGIMLLYFVFDKNSSYYSTALFNSILQYISARRSWVLKDNDSKLWVRIPDVRSIEKGYHILQEIAENRRNI